MFDFGRSVCYNSEEAYLRQFLLWLIRVNFMEKGKSRQKTDCGKLELKSTLEIKSELEMYKVVDFLNKNLKHKNLIFGLSKNGERMTLSIYET